MSKEDKNFSQTVNKVERRGQSEASTFRTYRAL